MLFSSQDDENSIVRDESYSLATNKINPIATVVKSNKNLEGINYSPVKKRSRRNMSLFKMFGQSIGENTKGNNKNINDNFNTISSGIAMLNFSQDTIYAASCVNSQFSQEFVDRVNELSVGSSEDLNPQPSTDAFLFSDDGYLNSTYSNDAFTNPFPSIRYINSQENDYTASQPSQTSIFSTPAIPKNDLRESGKKASINDMRIEIPLPNPLENPFYTNTSYDSKAVNGPKSIWVSAFSERSRMLTDYVVLNPLGEGHFSSVFKVKHRIDGMIYAVKRLKKAICTMKEKQLIMREVHALAKLSYNCPNIIHYNSSWIDDNILYIQTELCELGNLDEWFVISDSNSINNKNHSDSITSSNDQLECTQHEIIVSNYKTRNNSVIDCNYFIPEELIWFLMTKISETLEYMHSKDMVHLDIRPGNIFISSNPGYHNNPKTSLSYEDISNGILNNIYSIKIGDFGHCCLCNTNELISEGETRYCPIELVSSDKPVELKNCDMFSLGITMYELCIGRVLGSDTNDSNEWHDIRDGKLIRSFYDNYSVELTNVILKLMDNNPSNRPSAHEIFTIASKYCHKIFSYNGNEVMTMQDLIERTGEIASSSDTISMNLLNQINILQNEIKLLKEKNKL